MAKKVTKKPDAKQMFDIKPAFYSIVLDLDFCDDLAKFISKNKGTGMIAGFGKNMHKAACRSTTVSKAVEKPAGADKLADKKVVSEKAAKAEKVKRERLAKKAKQLHAKGKSFRAIGKALGVSAITAARYCKK
ncbi:MAG: helix-turn-helix domain-containing protein [Candidatus Paceibacterota bacterium]|jgi:hypothetical protein